MNNCSDIQNLSHVYNNFFKMKRYFFMRLYSSYYILLLIFYYSMFLSFAVFDNDIKIYHMIIVKYLLKLNRHQFILVLYISIPVILFSTFTTQCLFGLSFTILHQFMLLVDKSYCSFIRMSICSLRVALSWNVRCSKFN